MYQQFIKEAQEIQRNKEGGILKQLQCGLEKLIERGVSPKRGVAEQEEDYNTFRQESLEYLIKTFSENIEKHGADADLKSLLAPGEWFLSQIVLTQ